MQSVVNSTSSQTSEFESTMKKLSYFKEAGVPSQQRIVVNRNATIALGHNPGFWKRICEFFYKPRHLRLEYVVTKSVEYFQNNKAQFDKEENLNYLRSFRTRLYCVKSLQKKVNATVLKKLEGLIHEATQKKIDERLKQQMEITKAKKAAAELVEQTEQYVQTLKSIQQTAENTSTAKINVLKDSTYELTTSFNQTKEDVDYDAYHKIKQSEIFLKTERENVTQFCKENKPDLVFNLRNGGFGSDDEVFAHSIFFPELLEKNMRIAKLNASNRKDNIKYVIELNARDVPDISFSSFLNFLYGKDEKPQYSIVRLVLFYFISENLHLSNVRNAILKLVNSFSSKDCFATVIAVETLANFLKLLDPNPLTIDLLKILEKTDLEKLKNVPKNVRTLIAFVLGNVDKDAEHYNCSRSILTTWKNNGLI